jgi:hypothetical protein
VPDVVQLDDNDRLDVIDQLGGTDNVGVIDQLGDAEDVQEVLALLVLDELAEDV